MDGAASQNEAGKEPEQLRERKIMTPFCEVDQHGRDGKIGSTGCQITCDVQPAEKLRPIAAVPASWKISSVEKIRKILSHNLPLSEPDRASSDEVYQIRFAKRIPVIMKRRS